MYPTNHLSGVGLARAPHQYKTHTQSQTLGRRESEFPAAPRSNPFRNDYFDVHRYAGAARPQPDLPGLRNSGNLNYKRSHFGSPRLSPAPIRLPTTARPRALALLLLYRQLGQTAPLLKRPVVQPDLPASQPRRKVGHRRLHPDMAVSHQRLTRP